MVMLLHSRVVSGLHFNMPHEFLGGKKPPACFTTLKHIDPDHFIANGNGPYATLVFHLNSASGTDIGAGTTPDAEPFFGNNKTHTITVSHCEGRDIHNFPTDMDTQTATNAAIGNRAQRHAIGFRQVSDPFGLRRHGKQVPEGDSPRFFNPFTLCLYYQPLPGLQNTGKQNPRFSGTTQNFNAA